MIRKTLLFFATGFIAFLACATEVSLQQATAAVGCWLKEKPALGCPLGLNILDSRTCQSPRGTRFHVVRLQGGGFVVMSADTKQEPVVAFSSDSDLVESDRNPLWSLLCGDFDGRPEKTLSKAQAAATSNSAAVTAAERKWAKLLSTSTTFAKIMSAPAKTSVSDVRVAPFIASTWGQDTVNGAKCYNLLTPKNYPVGCVATAGAQIMRYFEWPKAKVSSFENPYCEVDGEVVTLSADGGVYDWANMPLRPGAETSHDQRLELSRLMHDLGVACGMSYRASGSGTGNYMLTRAWTTHFGYANASTYTPAGDVSADVVRRALVSNLDARLPVAVGISGPDGGHAIVGDGYGYSDGTLYYHFNMGWDGNSNAWYAPPDLSAGGYAFNAVGSLVYNIFTERSAGHTICSGRVLTAGGVPIPGATVIATDHTGTACAEVTTDANGIYALILPTSFAYATPYVLRATYDGKSAERSVRLKMSISTIVNENGTFRPDTAPAPAVNNMIDQDLTITEYAGVATPTFSPAPGLFHPAVTVSISCATEGATVRYTTDGSEPSESSTAYTAPFTLTRTTTVKAKAFKPGMLPSPTVAVEFTYDATLDGPVGDFFAHPIELSGESGSHLIPDTSAYTKEDYEPIHSLENGSYYPEARSAWYAWTAPGTGEMTFSVRSSKTIGSTKYFLHAMIAVYRGDDLRSAERIALFGGFDNNGGTSVTLKVQNGERYRIVVFAYAGDPYAGPYPLTWTGELETAQATVTTAVPVPFAWLSERYPGTTDFESCASSTGANGRPVWESYLLSLEPTNSQSVLRITRFGLNRGVPFFGWNVTNENIRALGYEYRVKGKASWGDPWSDTDAAHRFFRLFVERLR